MHLIRQIPRFSNEPIRIVPNYLYQNPHQGPYAEIKPNLLEDLKRTPASSDLIQRAARETRKPEEQVTTEFDWVTSIGKIEKMLKKHGENFSQYLFQSVFTTMQKSLDR